VLNVATVIATAVNADGHREMLGGLHRRGRDRLDHLSAWLGRPGPARRPVISDSHPGLKAAIAAVLPGAA